MDDPEPPLDKEAASCKICTAFLDAAIHVKSLHDAHPADPVPVAESSESREWDLGGFEAVYTKSSCKKHEPMLFACIRPENQQRLVAMSLQVNWGRMSLQIGLDEDGRIWYSSPAEFVVNSVSNGSKLLGIGLGRTLDPNYIDPALLRRWKTDCATHHGSKCSEKLLMLDEPLDFLIDCQRMCLIPAPENAHYIALSYVWGQIPTLKAYTRNLQKFQEEMILNLLEEDIATTIRDAMKLVPMLGERYLWVDSLCIAQDDEDSLKRHISQMARIFENATLTIVVADGADATSGLSGLMDVSKPRKLAPGLKLNDDLSVTIRLDDILRWSPWTKRGWTMQEQIFSRRKLVFFKNSARWICRSNTYYEEVNSPHDLNPKYLALDGGELRDNFSPFDISLNVPDLSILCNLIAHYNRRHLTFDEDVTAAFSSTFSAMKEAFPRGFFYGLPISFFDATLLWRSGSNNLRRRQPSKNNESVPPSWTWEGWQGYLESHSWTSACYMKNPPYNWGRAHWEPFQAIPILTWHIRDSKDGSMRILPFQNEWYNYKSKYMGKEVELPGGWKFMSENPVAENKRVAEKLKAFEDSHKACEDPECKISYEQLQTPYYYEHESCSTIKFWHPIPFGSMSDSQKDPQQSIPYGRYLCAKTQQVRLVAARPRYNTTLKRAVSYIGPEKYVVSMFGTVLGVTAVFRNDNGDEIGELCVDAQSDLQTILATDTGICCDVVVVSRGLNYPDPQPTGKETWSFVNVLWVSWKDGVACRKGVGRLKRSAWEELEKEETLLVLG